MFATNGDNRIVRNRGSNMADDGTDRNSPDRMSVPYICLTAVVAVLAGVVLAWLG